MGKHYYTAVNLEGYYTGM